MFPCGFFWGRRTNRTHIWKDDNINESIPTRPSGYSTGLNTYNLHGIGIEIVSNVVKRLNVCVTRVRYNVLLCFLLTIFPAFLKRQTKCGDMSLISAVIRSQRNFWGFWIKNVFKKSRDWLITFVLEINWNVSFKYQLRYNIFQF